MTEPLESFQSILHFHKACESKEEVYNWQRIAYSRPNRRWNCIQGLICYFMHFLINVMLMTIIVVVLGFIGVGILMVCIMSVVMPMVTMAVMAMIMSMMGVTMRMCSCILLYLWFLLHVNWIFAWFNIWWAVFIIFVIIFLISIVHIITLCRILNLIVCVDVVICFRV